MLSRRLGRKRRAAAAIGVTVAGVLVVAGNPAAVTAQEPEDVTVSDTGPSEVRLVAAPGQRGKGGQWSKAPDKVVIIMVDALNREIVDRYKMRNVQRLMKSGADSPRGYLGHLGSVTVVTHNVVTTGALPKNMGFSSDGYRDIDGVLADEDRVNPSDIWLTSEWSKDQFFAVQKKSGYPKLADYLHRRDRKSKFVAISPKGYAGWGLGGPGADSIVTFSGRSFDCDGDGVKNWRGPDGVNVPAYLSSPECGRFYVDSASSKTYDTFKSPARLYPLDGDRYTTGFDPEHEGGDVWAADAAIEVMRQEPRWGGIAVTLPGLDKSAHMWGGIDDPEAEGDDGVPMTHMKAAAKTADAQVGKIVQELKRSGEWKDTLVVLTSDHGSVPARDFHGEDDGSADRGYHNWYYGAVANGTYLEPQAALQPLVDTGNIEELYNDSMISAWLKERDRASVEETADVMRDLPGVVSVWARKGRTFEQLGETDWSAMGQPGEKKWYRQHARELVNTAAAPSGPDLVALLADDTAYDVAGSHGGIQRRSQQIPIVFAGADVSSRDLRGKVRSVDIMPTILRAMGIRPVKKLDGVAWKLHRRTGR